VESDAAKKRFPSRNKVSLESCAKAPRANKNKKSKKKKSPPPQRGENGHTLPRSRLSERHASGNEAIEAQGRERRNEKEKMGNKMGGRTSRILREGEIQIMI
jgi:hypothetical protein